MQQGRQECRPSDGPATFGSMREDGNIIGRQECRPFDGPATLLSPMVGMEICFFQSGPKLVLVGRLL